MYTIAEHNNGMKIVVLENPRHACEGEKFSLRQFIKPYQPTDVGEGKKQIS